MSKVIEGEEKQTLELEVMPLRNKAISLVVKSHDERAMVVTDVKNARVLREKIEERFHPTANKVAAYEVYQATLDTEKQFYEPIDLFIKNGTQAVKSWDTSETLRIQRQQREEQDKKDQAEREEKAKRDAEEKAAIESEEKRQLEEFERLEKEKKAKEDLQKAATDSGNVKVAGIAAKEVAKIEGQIADVQQQGAANIAAIHEKAAEPPAEKVKFNPPPAPIKKLVWKARVVNMMKLCNSVASGDVPFTVMAVSQSELNDFAKKYDGSKKIPGLEFYQEATGRI